MTQRTPGGGGLIGTTHHDSTPGWPTPSHPGDDAPNVVVILLDDLGFAQLGCFGSDIPTPHIDALAAGGLRYANFHVTPLCSPTRVALLTGRNHHSVGMRALANFDSGYPHMRGKISDDAATMGEVLRDEGYITFALGKWHLCPMDEASAAGPFDQWPLQRGFDRFYGFLDGETDQFTPDLVYDNHRIDPPRSVADGYHLTEDLVDKAIEFVHDATSVRPDRPFFTYLALGATHAPHQAPDEYLRRQHGRYDEGWDVARRRWFARQREMGLLPDGTRLAPRNPGVEAWEDLPDAQRRLAIRLQEAFAAFLEHTDAQIGRLISALEAIDVLDDTIVMVLSDNGASQEGGPFGVLHEMKYFNFLLEQPEEAVDHLDDIGGPRSHANYPWGWAQAGNTPFKWYKQNTHEGGVHVPLIVHWPRGIADPGSVRHGFGYVTDVAATVYDAAGITPPEVYRGVPQLPMAGRSLCPTFGARPRGAAPTEPRIQYFEMMGHRGIYADGWKAVTRHRAGVPYDDDRWELYDLRVDASECEDLASVHPDTLTRLIALWWEEARDHGVLPLDDRTVELFGSRFREHSTHPADRTYTYRPPMAPLPPQAAAAIAGRSWDLTAHVDRRSGQDGVLYAMGNANSGLSLFVEGDRLVFDYNCFGEHHVVESTRAVPVGPSAIGVRFRREGRAGRAELVVDEIACGAISLPFVMGMISSVGASVGRDHGSPVSERYAAENPFVGVLRRLEIALRSPRSAEDAEQAAVAERATMTQQ